MVSKFTGPLQGEAEDCCSLWKCHELALSSHFRPHERAKCHSDNEMTVLLFDGYEIDYLDQLNPRLFNHT
jgi:hypothetical protein